jgi:hypothetical protein
MRTILRFLALAAAFPLLAAGAEAQTAWSVSTLSPRGAALVPAPVQSSAADGNGDLVVVANDPAARCFATIKYQRASGAIMWRQELCGVSASAMTLDGVGNVLVAGTASDGMRLIKYSGADGSTRWEKRSGSAGDSGYAVALDPNGDVFMLGAARALTMDLWIAKHRGVDGALVWQQPAEGGADTTPAGLAVDRDGNALAVGTYRNARGDEDWHLAKLAGSSGAILWRKVYDSGGRDIAAGVAVDGNGNAIVAGTRVVKSEGATGRTLWQQSLQQPASRVLLDEANNVVTVSPGDGIRVVKLSEAQGGVVWQSSQVAGGNAAVGALARDADGGVLVAGTTFAAGAEMRTLKVVGSDGALAWGAAHRSASPGAGDGGHAVVPAAGAVYAVGVSSEPQGAGLRVIRYVERIAAALQPLAINVQGLWWRGPEESGWGINLTQQGDVLFATWFTYDDEGQPQWLVMSDGRRVEDRAFSGTLYRTRGPAFSAVPFDPAQVQREPVGKATLRFDDAQNGTFSYEVGAASGSKAITRQVFSSPQPQCAQGGASTSNPNYQDLWWAPQGRESGWGFNIAHQGDILFLTWFTYGMDGRGTWLVASRVERTGSNTFAGTLYRAVGPPLGAQPWNPARVALAAAGEVRLAFVDGNNGTFSYTLDGVTQSKTVTRQVYATPKTVCR